jgi:hypothetical protein
LRGALIGANGKGQRGRRLAFFLELLFPGMTEPRRGSEGLTIIEKWKIAHVQADLAARGLLVNDDGDGAPLDALAEGHPASARQPRMCETLHH